MAEDAPPDVDAVDTGWLAAAIELSRRCPPSSSAFAVGAVIVAADQRVLADGYSRQEDPQDHAEEGALRRVADADASRLATATLYSSLEPCSRRLSRPVSCTALILAAGVRRVVFALREPAVFVDGRGAEELSAAGVAVVERPDLADGVRAVNRHVLDPPT